MRSRYSDKKFWADAFNAMVSATLANSPEAMIYQCATFADGALLEYQKRYPTEYPVTSKQDAEIAFQKDRADSNYKAWEKGQAELKQMKVECIRLRERNSELRTVAIMAKHSAEYSICQLAPNFGPKALFDAARAALGPPATGDEAEAAGRRAYEDAAREPEVQG